MTLVRRLRSRDLNISTLSKNAHLSENVRLLDPGILSAGLLEVEKIASSKPNLT